ncbi:MAG: dTDP-glucose 4,6-dehydratase [Acidobacteria bacterium]|nr:MAG: dTDP-glucose 4,6-dehydratase [Acidobacteriota bacterium]
MKLAITGGAGFIGSNFIRYMLGKYPAYNILNLDNLTYSGNLENLSDVLDNPGHQFLKVDICRRDETTRALSQGIDAVVHFAAESHVDRSILDGSVFVRTNVLGTQSLLEAARQSGVQRFLHVSTDEVYGSAPGKQQFQEGSPLAPNSPYAASKAASDLLARAYFQTYRFPVIVTRCSNNFGPYQFPEKFIPLLISRALEDQSIPIYGDGLQVRDWIFVEDHCRALDAVLHSGREGEVYNIGGGNEWPNLEIAGRILDLLRKPHSLLTYVQDRPGHDRRYSVNSEKIETELGWRPEMHFAEGLARTIDWYVANTGWRERIQNQAYRSYYQEQYEQRDETLRRIQNPGGSSACASL